MTLQYRYTTSISVHCYFACVEYHTSTTHHKNHYQNRPTSGSLLSLFCLRVCTIYGKEGCCVWETVHISVHFCTVLMSMCNITFQFLRLGTFVLKKCSENKIVKIIFVVKSSKDFGWNIISPATQTVVQHYISTGPIYIMLSGVSGAEMLKRHPHNAAVRKHGTIMVL